MTPFIFLVLVLVAARLTRLVFKDSIFHGPRERLVNAFEDPVKVKDGGLTGPKVMQRNRLAFWFRSKIAEMVECPYCCSGWISAGALFAHRLFVDDFATPVWIWLAVWMGVLIVLEWTDSES